MFGIGTMELIILGLFCLLPMVAGAAGLVVLVVYLLKKNSSSSLPSARPTENTDAQP